MSRSRPIALTNIKRDCTGALTQFSCGGGNLFLEAAQAQVRQADIHLKLAQLAETSAERAHETLKAELLLEDATKFRDYARRLSGYGREYR